MTTLAALLTVHNRRATTLACLDALLGQLLPAGIRLSVFLVDDGSTDGTAEAVRERFPEVRLLQGSGSLFWNGGMRLAFSKALKEGFDYYLWLNDDTHLYPGALHVLLETSLKLGPEAIVVGSVQDPHTGAHTYGGVVRSNRYRPLRFSLVAPGEAPRLVDTMNGNCVLIPRQVAEKVGNLDPNFTHSMGDFDYGLRARRLGFGVWVAPGYVGTCARNSMKGTWCDSALPLRERWRKVREVKGLPPEEWRVFAQRYAGSLWPVYWLSPYLRLLLSSVTVKVRRRFLEGF
ncbi:MAG: glycosyltransferase family 2 protein [Candidatus Methanomethyliaceae archaeon]